MERLDQVIPAILLENNPSEENLTPEDILYKMELTMAW